MLNIKLRKLRNRLGKTQEEIANQLGISRVRYNQYETGKRTPDTEMICSLAEIFNVTTDYLLDSPTMKLENKKGYITVKVYGSVPAGIPIEAIEDVIDEEDLSLEDYSPYHEYVGIRVKGDSMYPRYEDGDVIIVQVQPDCENRQDAVVFVNGYEATLKTVVKNNDGTITLQPVNPMYPPRTYGPGDDPITIFGIVKELRRKMN